MHDGPARSRDGGAAERLLERVDAMAKSDSHGKEHVGRVGAREQRKPQCSNGVDVQANLSSIFLGESLQNDVGAGGSKEDLVAAEGLGHLHAPGVVSVDIEGAILRQGFHNLAFSLGHVLYGSKSFQMGWRHKGDGGLGRTGPTAQGGDLALVVCAHFDDGEFRAAIDSEK